MGHQTHLAAERDIRHNSTWVTRPDYHDVPDVGQHSSGFTASHGAQNAPDQNSKASKQTSSLSPHELRSAGVDPMRNSGGPAVANLPTKEATPRPAKNSSIARRKRRLHKAMIPIGRASSEQMGSDIDCKARVQQGLAPSMPCWCAQLMDQFAAGGDSQLQAALSLCNSVWALSKDKLGCRAVQEGLKVAPRKLQDVLVLELHGHVRDAVDSAHANFVIQLVVEIMPVARTAFVAEELTGLAAQVARHRYGCRVIIRLLEHSATEKTTISITNELLEQCQDLLRHSFGRFVLQAVLEHGLPEQRHKIAVALRSGPNDQNGNAILWNAMNRNASCVFETAMLFCSEEDKDGIRKELLGKPASVLKVGQNSFGFFVLRSLLECPGETTQDALAVIQEASPVLLGSKQGRKLLGLLPNSDLADVAP